MNKNKKPLPKMTPGEALPGAVIAERKRCGKPNCRCASGNPEDLHGPYYYRYYRENGRLRKAYVPKDRVEQVRAACALYREEQRTRRWMALLFQQHAQSVDEMLRQIEALWKS